MPPVYLGLSREAIHDFIASRFDAWGRTPTTTRAQQLQQLELELFERARYYPELDILSEWEMFRFAIRGRALSDYRAAWRAWLKKARSVRAKRMVEV